MSKKYLFDETHCPEELYSGPLSAIHPVCMDIMYRRGLRSVSDICAFLFPNFEPVLRNTGFKDMDKAVWALSTAVTTKQKIAVYHDYDADGCCAAAVAVDGLRSLGADVVYYCNDRAIDGFGLCENGIDNILSTWPDVKIVLTVDNGITSVDGVTYANSKGLTVIVTDHHEPGMELPNAAAVIDAKQADEIYPYHDLCGTGIAFKLMSALYQRFGIGLAGIAGLADIAALATVADVVPLLGENRAIVKEGLKYINKGSRPVFRAMNTLTNQASVTSRTLAFSYAPMINALARMGKDPKLAVELLLSQDLDSAMEMTQELMDINDQRKELSKEQCDKALSMVDPDHLPPAIVLYDESFSEGLVGIVAGRVKEEFDRPVIVFAQSNYGTLKGSGRSVEGFDIKNALDRVTCSGLLSHGGHKMAAGVTISAEFLDDFTKEFRKLAEPCLDSMVVAKKLDAVLDADDLTERVVVGMRVMEPYGEGFPEPLLGLRADCDATYYMGAEHQHVKYMDTKRNLAVIQWNGGDAARNRETTPKKFVGHASLNEFKGKVNVQFICE